MDFATKLALAIWFQAIYIIRQAKTGLFALALKRQLGLSYLTSWLIRLLPFCSCCPGDVLKLPRCYVDEVWR